jgi:hypothetical protein
MNINKQEIIVTSAVNCPFCTFIKNDTNKCSENEDGLCIGFMSDDCVLNNRNGYKKIITITVIGKR